MKVVVCANTGDRAAVPEWWTSAVAVAIRCPYCGCHDCLGVIDRAERIRDDAPMFVELVAD